MAPRGGILLLAIPLIAAALSAPPPPPPQPIAQSTTPAANQCAEIESAFAEAAAAENEEPACRCMPKGFRLDESDEEYLFVGCTGQNMPSVYHALHALNDTPITQLKIWDSVINLVPTDMFAKVRPMILSIEGSAVSFFRPEPFALLGERLKSLFLRNNILQSIDNKTFTHLERLEILDLSGNKLKAVQQSQYTQLPALKMLLLRNNKIAQIDDGAFIGLHSLQTLNLAENKLKKITKNTFAGLDNLEVLELEGNQLESVDWAAFAHMKKLRFLNLGNNSLSRVELRDLPILQDLYLNHNQLRSVRDIALRNVPTLKNLKLDRNRIAAIRQGDLHPMGVSAQKLWSLSLVANNLSRIDANALAPLSNLGILSLQNNALKSLRSSPLPGVEPISWVAPLRQLKSLYLSRNNLTQLEDGDLNVVPSLEEVSMDNNQLQMIDKTALRGLQLRRLYLNNNLFHYLPESLFDDWDTNVIYSVDLAENPWECICGREWLGEWLSKLGDRSTPSGDIGCVLATCVPVEEPKHSAWITVVAGVLAFVALVFLTAIAYLYLHEQCARGPPLPSSLKRVPSDMVRLIPSLESLSFPNPVAADLKDRLPTVVEEGSDHRPQKLQTPDDEKEKKRVRFNDA